MNTIKTNDDSVKVNFLCHPLLSHCPWIIRGSTHCSLCNLGFGEISQVEHCDAEIIWWTDLWEGIVRHSLHLYSSSCSLYIIDWLVNTCWIFVTLDMNWCLSEMIWSWFLISDALRSSLVHLVAVFSFPMRCNLSNFHISTVKKVQNTYQLTEECAVFVNNKTLFVFQKNLNPWSCILLVKIHKFAR